MAKIKDTPNLPGSSRMQMPSTSNGFMRSQITEYAGLKNGKATANIKGGGVSSRITNAAKGKTGMKGSNPYC